ncbi:MAG: STAS domain-containing protein [Lysobacteraceae bacterium]
MKRCHTEDRNEHRVVVLSGEVDLSWSQQVRREVLDALKASDRVAVDLSSVSYIDSSGIAALVEGFQQARGKGQQFVLLSASPPVMAVLKLARLDKVFQLVDQLD